MINVKKVILFRHLTVAVLATLLIAQATNSIAICELAASLPCATSGVTVTQYACDGTSGPWLAVQNVQATQIDPSPPGGVQGWIGTSISYCTHSCRATIGGTPVTKTCCPPFAYPDTNSGTCWT